MHTVKKHIALLFLLLLISAIFVGCGEDKGDDTLPYDDESRIPINNDKNSSSTEDVTGDFLVKSKKYTFEGKDLVILNVENQTNKNYTVTAIVRYLDEEGNEIKTQKQTFSGWASGYQNYFLFQPDITFHEFEYTIQLNEYEEDCLAENFSMEPMGINYSGYRGLTASGTKYHQLVMKCKIASYNSTEIDLSGWIIVMDNTGDIYKIHKYHGNFSGIKYISPLVYYSLDDLSNKSAWPKELTGEVSAIFVVTDCTEKEPV